MTIDKTTTSLRRKLITFHFFLKAAVVFCICFDIQISLIMIFYQFTCCVSAIVSPLHLLSTAFSLYFLFFHCVNLDMKAGEHFVHINNVISKTELLKADVVVLGS